MARTVTPKSNRIAELRNAKPWTQEQLALNSGISQRTIQSIEAGTPCYLFTLNAIAEALNAPLSSLYGEPQITPGKYEISFVLSTPFDEFDQARDLPLFISIIERLLHGNVDLIKVERGSTRIFISITEEQIRWLPAPEVILSLSVELQKFHPEHAAMFASIISYTRPSPTATNPSQSSVVNTRPPV